MKNIFVTLCTIFLLTQANAFADEIIQADGTTIKCKVETVMDGFVEYKQNGTLASFTRVSDSPMFSDYVIVKDKLFKKECITKYTGRIIIKYTWATKILTNDGREVEIPFFRVKSIGIYKP